MTSLLLILAIFFPKETAFPSENATNVDKWRGCNELLERESITSEFVCYFESTVCKVNHEMSAGVGKIFASSRFGRHQSLRIAVISPTSDFTQKQEEVMVNFYLE